MLLRELCSSKMGGSLAVIVNETVTEDLSVVIGAGVRGSEGGIIKASGSLDQATTVPGKRKTQDHWRRRSSL